MSNYYSNIDFKIEPNNNLKSNEKNKFIIKNDPSKDIPGHWTNDFTKNECIDNETKLIKPIINSKDKTQVILNDSFHPENYNLNYSNRYIHNIENNNIYYSNKNEGAGRGFGNLNVSNNIRYGNFTRIDTKEFKEKQEQTQFLDFHFQYLDKNFQDPDNLVMPIPRGGEQTRKQSQLSVNTMRTFQNKDSQEYLKTIKFDY